MVGKIFIVIVIVAANLGCDAASNLCLKTPYDAVKLADKIEKMKTIFSDARHLLRKNSYAVLEDQNLDVVWLVNTAVSAVSKVLGAMNEVGISIDVSKQQQDFVNFAQTMVLDWSKTFDQKSLEGITFVMKIAKSFADDVFTEALEVLAADIGWTTSELTAHVLDSKKVPPADFRCAVYLIRTLARAKNIVVASFDVIAANDAAIIKSRN